ncbi:MAG: ferrochelatase [Nocardioidaceae bacterium]
MAHDVRPYDALLLVSFGGPEGPGDVLPFLQNVTRGRGISRERLEAVGEHYQLFGGRSPINDECRDLLAAIRAELARSGIDLAVYWGNRNWDPYLSDTLARMSADGVRRAACLLTSAYASYSGCRQYRENLYDAVDAVEATGAGTPRLDRLRHYFNHPGFVEPLVDATLAAVGELDPAVRDGARIVFVTHSIPTAMNDASGRFEQDGAGSTGAGPTGGGAYVRQHRDVARTVAARVAETEGFGRGTDLVYCSRSGSPHTPWLEPDVNDHLELLARDGAQAVVLVPVGFISDHMEVVFDLDTEASATADRLGLAFARAATPGADPRFAAMVRDLLVERAAVERDARPVERASTGDLPPSWDVCPPGCCANPRGPRPALCGADSERVHQ